MPAAALAILQGLIAAEPLALAVWGLIQPLLASVLPASAQTTLIGILEALISTEPTAQATWAFLKPALAAGRDPTQDEWTQLDAMADLAHARVQGAAP